MGTAPAPHWKARRRGLLWLAGTRSITQHLPQAVGTAVAVPSTASACLYYLPALLPTLPMSAHSVSHQTPRVRHLSFSRAIASAASSACAGVGAGEGLLRETSPSRSGMFFTNQPSSAAGSTSCSFARLYLSTAVYGKEERRELWLMCGNQDSLSPSGS